jgi:5-methylcytosine-specific restriction protein B
MFSWKPIYMELAKALMAYRDRQGELLGWLAEMKTEGLPVIKLNDEKPKGNTVPLAEIDPFSFFANFNRGIKEEYRRRILEVLKDKMGLKAPLPDDFDGLPFVHPQKALFFPYAYDRREDDVSKLWELAQEVVSKSPGELSDELFKRCLDIRQVGIAKLTIGMFWLNPETFLALDSLMMDYLEGKGVVKGGLKKVCSSSEYAAVVMKVCSALGSDYAKVSWDAFSESNQVPLTAEQLDAGLFDLLRGVASSENCTVEEAVSHIAVPQDRRETEFSNRANVLPKISAALTKRPVSCVELQNVCPQLWVLKNGNEATRRSAFLKNSKAPEAIEALIDQGAGIEDMPRIDSFVEQAVACGYTDPAGTGAADATQFASVLLSALYPDRYVDYRDNRWTALFQLVSKSKRRLYSGAMSNGWKVVCAGKFAAALASTPTFVRYFGSEHGLWKAAALAWYVKDGVKPMKRYWAGGFLWGGQSGKGESHLEDFLAGNCWQTGYSRDQTDSKSAEHWKLFDQIQVGDEFAIKGYGGRNDLKIYYVGEVELIDGKKGMIKLKRLDRKLYHGKAPSPGGGGNWFGTLLEVGAPSAIEALFFGKDAEPEVFQHPLNLILFGPPGTGKTFYTVNHAVAICDQSPVEGLGKERAAVTERFAQLQAQGRVEFVTFHQSMSYEDFVEGIKPDVTSNAGIAYSVKPGVFAAICDRARDNWKSWSAGSSGSRAATFQNFVLIIDEINRGNVSAILGELITLLEDDKRLGEDNELQVTLPYSKEPFGVPPNLYIVGTMNTADRSVEALDTALRRRFCFEEMTPSAELLNADVEGVDLKRLLNAINGRLEALVDRDHMIGHAFFMPVAGLEDLKQVFQHKVLPLLQEYFYGDWAKIHLVLGDGFIQEKRLHGTVTWPKGSERPDDLADRKVWTIVPPQAWTVDTFKQVYEVVEV